MAAFGRSRLLAALLLVLVPTSAAAQGPAPRPAPARGPAVDAPASRPAPLERWQKMSPAERVELERRFAELRKMSKAERETLRERARELEAERGRLEKQLGPNMRERLRRMPPVERDRILREHQVDEHRRAGEALREGLDPERVDWVDRLIGPDHPRPLHDLRRELRGKLEDRLVERWHKNGNLDEKERERLAGLSPRKRAGELLRIHRHRIVQAVKARGLPADVKPEKWKQLLGEERPERFLKHARKLGLDRLVEPPVDTAGKPGRPGAGRPPFREGPRKGTRLPPPAGGMRELAELLRPTMEDRLDTASKPPDERHALVDGRIAKRVRKRLAEAGWLPGIERGPLEGLGSGALLERLRDFLHTERRGRRNPRR